MKVIFYEGERIYFRPVEMEDEARFRQWINHPDIWSTLGHRLPINQVQERHFIEKTNTKETDIIFGIVAKENDQLIGSTGLHRIHSINRHATFGIMIGDFEKQNQGYGSEAVKLTLQYAFEELNLNRVGLCVFSHNLRAIHVYEKEGFVYEGCMRQAYFRNGQYHDELRYAVLREDWLNRVSDKNEASIVCQ